MSLPVINLSFSKIPTAVAFQMLPLTDFPTSAISPPGIITFCSIQAFARPFIKPSITLASILFVSIVLEMEIVSAPKQTASSATIARRS